MNALRIKPNERYDNLSSFAADMECWLEGRPLSSMESDQFYRFKKWAGRHRTILASTMVVLLLMGLFVGLRIRDAFKTWGAWELVHDVDFSDPDADLSLLKFRKEVSAGKLQLANLQSGSLTLSPGEWAMISEPVRGNVRVELTVKWPDEPENIQVLLGGNQMPLTDRYMAPGGYVFRILSTAGGEHGVFRLPQGTRMLKNTEVYRDWYAPAWNYSNEEMKIELSLVDGAINLALNEKSMMERIDEFPLSSKDFNRVGFRSWQNDTQFLRLRVWRQSHPEVTSPLTGPDALLHEGLSSEALRGYLSIADDFVGRPLEEKALVKAWHLMRELGQDGEDVLTRLEAIHPRSEPLRIIHKRLAVDAWGKGDHQTAQALSDKILGRGPDPSFLIQLLNTRRKKLPEETRRWWLSSMAKNRNIKSLNLRNMGIENLEILDGMKLRFLELSGNPISDLEPLKNMPLEKLILNHCPVTDLEPLSTIALTALELKHTLIKDLVDLKNLKLDFLDISHTEIRDLQPLEGMRLRSLHLVSTKVHDLLPLKGAPLKTLNISLCPVDSLAPL